MISISPNHIIEINRGDDASFAFRVPFWGAGVDDEQYVLKEGDTLYVGIMEPNSSFEHALVRKAYTSADNDENGDVTISLASNDTICLLPGTYYIQAKLKRLEGKDDSGSDAYSIGTVLGKSKFVVLD